jgi:hypothetical protein
MNRLIRSSTARLPLLLAAGLLFAAACSDDSTGPTPEETRAEGELTILRFDSTTAGRIPLQASFWAVRGEDRELVMRALPAPGEAVGEKFLELEVEEDALLRRPDGTLFAEGDSVLITVTVDPSGRFLFDFQPAGLVFDPDEPAELSIRYVLADPDYDADGDVDDDDFDFESQLSIWRQANPADPFVRLLSFEIDDDELEAELPGFSGFALAN